MVTERDFLRRFETGTERHRSRWIELLTIVTVAEDASLEDAVRLMERDHIKQLLVVRGEALVGIVAPADILYAFIVGSPKPANVPVSDAASLGAAPFG